VWCVIVGGKDAWRTTRLLREQRVPVVVVDPHSLPLRQDDDVDASYRLPWLLQRDGVEVCIAVDGFWQVRNLSYQAGTCVEYGLSPEQALEAITLAPARLLGIDATTGSIEEGKDATLVVTPGDLLDMRSSDVERAFLRGRALDLDNIQKQLNRKFRDKYGLR
jgi:imidazolonepropionase-like amidohydrolase